MESKDAITVTHNEAAHRFEAEVEGRRATSEYTRAADRIVFTHTEVPEALEGRGVANALTRTALGYARAEGLKVVPLCPFVRAYLERHPEDHDLLLKR